MDAAGVAASTGPAGDACDNAPMESTTGLFETALIKPRRPWKTMSDAEPATAEYADWYNHRQLHRETGHIVRRIREPGNHETPDHNQHPRSLPNPVRVKDARPEARCNNSTNRFRMSSLQDLAVGVAGGRFCVYIMILCRATCGTRCSAAPSSPTVASAVSRAGCRWMTVQPYAGSSVRCAQE
ncbi:integrase core domain-containing protein [Streptomyces sp. NPDC051909]|uniref:integrase core domain-containing protein n=1 Tax=Streptomyces sp. NPDC051909 TaxID=3154944 RepID=UPI00343010D1